MSQGPRTARLNTIALVEALTATTKYDNRQTFKHDPKASGPEDLQDITRSFGCFWNDEFEYVKEGRPSAAHPFSSYEMGLDVVVNYREARVDRNEASECAQEDAALLLKQLPRIAASAYDTTNTGITLRLPNAITFDGEQLTVSVALRFNIGS